MVSTKERTYCITSSTCFFSGFQFKMNWYSECRYTGCREWRGDILFRKSSNISSCLQCSKLEYLSHACIITVPYSIFNDVISPDKVNALTLSTTGPYPLLVFFIKRRTHSCILYNISPI